MSMIHIGVLSQTTGGFFFGEVLAGVVREVAAAGGRVTLVQTLDAGVSGDELTPAPDVSAPIGWEHIDGFISVAQASSAAYLHKLRAAGKAVVLTSNALEGVDAASVVSDNHEGARGAVAHLVAHGHTRIGFVGNLAQTDMFERYEGYRAAMAEHGLADGGPLFFPTSDHVEGGGRAAAEAVLAAEPPVTAVVTSTDRIAIGLLRGLAERGTRVPQDVAVIGFDDIEPGWHTSPPLASINQDVAGLGARAARLVIAELRGEPVERRRYTVPSTLIPRGTCGCGGSAGAASRRGADDGRALVAAISAHLGLPAPDSAAAPTAVDPADVDLGRLDDLIEDTVARMYPRSPSPETLEHFTETVMDLLGRTSIALGAAGLPGGDVLRHCMARTTMILSHLQAVSGVARAGQLSVSLTEQYEVGMELLGRLGADASDLNWLARVSVRLGCLGLWDGSPEDGLLRIAGVYDPAGVITQGIGPTCRVQEFPPRALVEQTDPGRDEVTFVLPVKGASGDQGVLCVVGPVDTNSDTGRATYNHWAALLGVALKQQGLLEAVRSSEERYSLTAAAMHDGLWDWDVQDGTCFYSERCREMLGLPLAAGTDPRPDHSWRTEAPELDPWTERVHPDDLPALRANLRRAVDLQAPFESEHRITGPDGQYRWVLCRALPVGEPVRTARRIVGSLSDIHQRKELEEQLRQGALYDAVTGLPNRRMFLDRLAWAVEQAKRSDGARFAVIFLDLDSFKVINDSLGHLMGDELLKVVAERLHSDLRSVDTAARFGGDEFAVLLFGLKYDAVLSIVERIQERIAAPIMLGGHEVAITASVGIAASETGYSDAEDVLRDADIAMYHAKESERGTACVFDPVMHARATGRLKAQSELRTALLEHQFVMHYQPVVALDGSALTQFEALVRWDHPEHGLLLPADFLAVMAETGTIIRLGQWIIDTVCEQIAQWRRTYGGPLAVSVNLSHREFWSDQLLATVSNALSRHQVPASCLVLEITESVIMADQDAALTIMSGLRARGIRLHIDDFGTGQSSLHALRTFPVDALKIDQSFVQQIGVDAQTTELVRIIVSMGRTLGLDVVAEGVETNAQADRLRTMGCATAQGWLYASAIPGSEAGTLLGESLGHQQVRKII